MGLIQDTDSGPLRQGYVHLTFTLKEHKLSLVDTKVDLAGTVFAPRPPQPPHIVVEAAAEQVEEQATAILQAEGYASDEETSSELKISKPYTQEEMARFTQPGTVCQHVATIDFSSKARATVVTMNSETVCHSGQSGVRFPDNRPKDVETMQNLLQGLKDKVEDADQRP